MGRSSSYKFNTTISITQIFHVQARPTRIYWRTTYATRNRWRSSRVLPYLWAWTSSHLVQRRPSFAWSTRFWWKVPGKTFWIAHSNFKETTFTYNILITAIFGKTWRLDLLCIGNQTFEQWGCWKLHSQCQKQIWWKSKLCQTVHERQKRTYKVCW